MIYCGVKPQPERRVSSIFHSLYKWKAPCHWHVLLSEKASAIWKLLLEMIQPSSVYMVKLPNTPCYCTGMAKYNTELLTCIWRRCSTGIFITELCWAEHRYSSVCLDPWTGLRPKYTLNIQQPPMPSKERPSGDMLTMSIMYWLNSSWGFLVKRQPELHEILR